MFIVFFILHYHPLHQQNILFFPRFSDFKCLLSLQADLIIKYICIVLGCFNVSFIYELSIKSKKVCLGSFFVTMFLAHKSVATLCFEFLIPQEQQQFHMSSSSDKTVPQDENVGLDRAWKLPPEYGSEEDGMTCQQFST